MLNIIQSVSVCLFVSDFVYLYVCVSVSLCVFVSVCLCDSESVCQCFIVSVCLKKRLNLGNQGYYIQTLDDSGRIMQTPADFG